MAQEISKDYTLRSPKPKRTFQEPLKHTKSYIYGNIR